MSITTSVVSAPMKPCTVMIITRDGARTIRHTLDSIMRADCFVEILVLLDDRTRDATPAILQQYRSHGAPIRVVPYKWAIPANFSDARNYLLGFVGTPYATWLDDDEVISEPDKYRLMLQQARGQAFFFWVASDLSDGSPFNMYQPRLFPVLPGVFFECPVFERLDFSLRRQGVPTVKTMFTPIYHVGYNNNAILSKKRKRNREILEGAASWFMSGYEQTEHMAEQYRKAVG